MSASHSVYAVLSPTDEYRRMHAVYTACLAADIVPPREVEHFFGGNPPANVETMLVAIPAAKVEHSECSDAFEVDIEKLPLGATRVRFVISY